MNGSAPYSSVTGSHTRVTKKLKPNLCRASVELTHSSYTSSNVISTTIAAKIKVISRAISSPSRSLDKNEREPTAGSALGTVGFAVATSLFVYCTLLIACNSLSTTSFGSFA